MEIGLDKYGAGYSNYLATGTFLNPELYQNPTVEGRNAALQSRSGIYALDEAQAEAARARCRRKPLRRLSMSLMQERPAEAL